MTPRQCLSCTAGFRGGHKVYPASALTVDEAYELACQEKPVCEPGTKFVYSPWGYCLMAKVIEKVAGRPFAEALAERILKPYGLVDTAFVPDADRRIRIVDATYPWLKVPESDDCPWCAADCGLFSTEADLGKFARALLSDARMAGFFRKQTGKDVDRGFSFGFNLLPDGRIAFESSTGCSLSVDRRRNDCAVGIKGVR